MEGTLDSFKQLGETVNGFWFWEGRLNSRGGYQATVTVGVRIVWLRFMECGGLLLGNRFPV